MLLDALQWGTWVVSLLVFIGWLSQVRNDAKHNKPIHMAILVQTIFLLLAPISFVISSWNKFHLLWVVPMCLVLGWVMAFVIMRIPLIRGVLTLLFLSIGRILLAGVGGQIIGALGTGTERALETGCKRVETRDGLSSKAKNLRDNHEYLISTAQSSAGAWETAVFGKTFLGVPNMSKPLRVVRSWNFEDAEKEHSWCERAVENLPKSQWENTSGKKIILTTD
jgi:hypothetical protein